MKNLYAWLRQCQNGTAFYGHTAYILGLCSSVLFSRPFLLLRRMMLGGRTVVADGYPPVKCIQLHVQSRLPELCHSQMCFAEVSKPFHLYCRCEACICSHAQNAAVERHTITLLRRMLLEVSLSEVALNTIAATDICLSRVGKHVQHAATASSVPTACALRAGDAVNLV